MWFYLHQHLLKAYRQDPYRATYTCWLWLPMENCILLLGLNPRPPQRLNPHPVLKPTGPCSQFMHIPQFLASESTPNSHLEFSLSTVNLRLNPHPMPSQIHAKSSPKSTPNLCQKPHQNSCPNPPLFPHPNSGKPYLGHHTAGLPSEGSQRHSSAAKVSQDQALAVQMRHPAGNVTRHRHYREHVGNTLQRGWQRQEDALFDALLRSAQHSVSQHVAAQHSMPSVTGPDAMCHSRSQAHSMT